MFNYNNRVPYSLQNRNKVPTLSGVYLITDMYGNIKYVGQATDLRRRFEEHLSYQEQNTSLRNFIQNNYAVFQYAIINYQSNRNSEELRIYNMYRPPFNHIQPPAA